MSSYSLHALHQHMSVGQCRQALAPAPSAGHHLTLSHLCGSRRAASLTALVRVPCTHAPTRNAASGTSRPIPSAAVQDHTLSESAHPKKSSRPVPRHHATGHRCSQVATCAQLGQERQTTTCVPEMKTHWGGSRLPNHSSEQDLQHSQHPILPSKGTDEAKHRSSHSENQTVHMPQIRHSSTNVCSKHTGQPGTKRPAMHQPLCNHSQMCEQCPCHVAPHQSTLPGRAADL